MEYTTFSQPRVGSTDMWLWLCSIPDITRSQIAQVLSVFDSPDEAFTAPENEYKALMSGSRTPIWLRNLLSRRNDDFLSLVHAELNDKEISFVSCEDPGYPHRFSACPDPPFGLFYRGSLPDDSIKTAAIVGSRACTAYGTSMATAISRLLTEQGVSIISGMAAGIDAASQRAALECSGRSYGVFGCGVDICYPTSNIELYDTLPAAGGIISEYPCGTPPLSHNFPLRNRIISALSDLVIIIEARKKSGALITADAALEQGKEVYALPGRCTDMLSFGCNRLISQGAGIIITPEEFAAHLQETGFLNEPGGSSESRPGKDTAFNVSDPDLRRILSRLSETPVSPEAICKATGMSITAVLTGLMDLQLQGAIREISKNRYVRSVT